MDLEAAKGSSGPVPLADSLDADNEPGLYNGKYPPDHGASMAAIVILGGGISGLSLAYAVERRLPDADVVVLEANTRLGGTIATEERDGFRVEAGPNGFLDNKPFALSLCQNLGLGPRLIAASEAAGKNRFVLLDGRLRMLPGSLWSFVRSDLLSWPAKLRLLCERYRGRRKGYDDESIDDFARRRVGGEVANTLVDAFVTGIFAGDPKLLSVQASLPRLAEMERDHGSVVAGMARARRDKREQARLRGEPAPSSARQMWSFREGLGLLIGRLRETLRKPPLTGVAARSVRRQDDGKWLIRGDGRDQWLADAVVLTCPAYQQAAILAEQDPILAEQIAGIPYNRIAVVALGYRAADVSHRLDGFGYLSPQRSRREVLGVQWCSSIFPGRAPEGTVLLRAMCGGWHRGEIVDWREERIIDAVREEMRQALGITAPPIFHQIVRWDRAIPQYLVGHLERVAQIEERVARLPGLHVGGNSYRGVALNDCIERAEILAERIASRA